jgi:dolichol-phosphate mannosyltransferase
VAPLGDGMELVIGSRYIPGGVIPNWAWHRRLLSRGGNLYASALLGLGVSDATAGFRCYAAPLLDRLNLDAVRAEGYGFQIEMTYESRKAGASILEVPIRFVDRVEGESKMSAFIVVEALGLVTLWGVERLFGSFRRSKQVAHV